MRRSRNFVKYFVTSGFTVLGGVSPFRMATKFVTAMTAIAVHASIHALAMRARDLRNLLALSQRRPGLRL